MGGNKPYVDSFWATKKRQIPLKIGNVNVVWESSYGMTIKNPGMLSSDQLRELADDAIERAFSNEISVNMNQDNLERLAELAMSPQAASIEGESQNESKPEEPASEISSSSLDDLIAKGYLTVGVNK